MLVQVGGSLKQGHIVHNWYYSQMFPICWRGWILFQIFVGFISYACIFQHMLQNREWEQQPLLGCFHWFSKPAAATWTMSHVTLEGPPTTRSSFLAGQRAVEKGGRQPSVLTFCLYVEGLDPTGGILWFSLSSCCLSCSFQYELVVVLQLVELNANTCLKRI